MARRRARGHHRRRDRRAAVTVGGETTLPFLAFEGVAPHRPLLAVEVMDSGPGRLVAGAAVGVGRAHGRSRPVGETCRRAGRRPHRPAARQLPSGPRRQRRRLRRREGQAGARGRRRASPGVRPRHGRKGQRGPGRGRRGDQGRAARAGRLRGEELSHDRRRRPRQRPPRHRRDAYRCEPRQAAQHPHLRHGALAGPRAHGPQHGLARATASSTRSR